MNIEKNLIAGVVGWPISHSLSPRLHNYWLKKYNIRGEYLAFAVRPENLREFIESPPKDNIIGFNLTVPHKEIILPLLDEIDSVAEQIGAVNTVIIRDGRLLGFNTDGYGFLTHLKQSIPTWSAKDGAAVIIGAGGAARAAIVSLLNEGITEIRLINRTKERAEKLADIYHDPRIKVWDWQDRSESLFEAGLLVNTTTLGMTGQPELSINLSPLPATAVVYDIVYNPLETALLQQAKQKKYLWVDGLGMLLHQAAPAFQSWFKQKVTVDQKLRRHVLEGLSG
ncbi:MAG: shikimate dehydrogenase [Emcibacter sp.]|nr:shikimate dehydrogenase [Emcibacter sp.]